MTRAGVVLAAAWSNRAVGAVVQLLWGTGSAARLPDGQRAHQL